MKMPAKPEKPGDIYWQKIYIIIIIYKNLPYLKYYHIYIIII